MNTQAPPGVCVLLGSGETTPVGRRILSELLQQLDEPREIAVLDTPAGFQPNHLQVAGNIGQFLKEKLAEFRPLPQVVETRRASLGTAKETAALATLARARCIIAGPGSPTYMIRELADSSYLDMVRRAHGSGTALYMSSAAAIALSAFSLPVYEIFKAGEDPAWKTGLDFFGPFGMSLAIIPHWNNNEGGTTVDTRFCYMGQARFEALCQQLPPNVIIFGLDEHTACVLDFAQAQVTVAGKGAAHIVRDGQFMEWSAGKTFPMNLLSSSPSEHQQSADAQPFSRLRNLDPLPTLGEPVAEDIQGSKLSPQCIDGIVAVRTELRQAKHWAWSDQLRDALAAGGVVVEDTATGSAWHIPESD